MTRPERIYRSWQQYWLHTCVPERRDSRGIGVLQVIRGGGAEFGGKLRTPGIRELIDVHPQAHAVLSRCAQHAAGVVNWKHVRLAENVAEPGVRRRGGQHF